MKCPYNRKSEMHTQHWEQSPDESTGQIVRGSTIDKWNYSLMECEKENCGAWQDGRCQYAPMNLNNN